MKKVLYVLILLSLFPILIFSQRGIGEWTLNTSSTGRVFAMAIDPANPNNIYAGGLDGGVYKTTNGGTSWAASNTGMTYTAVQALAISPSNPLVLYAGTNQGNAGSGIYVTTNGGASWTLKNTGIQETSLGIQAFAVHPTNPLIAFVAVFDGVADSPVGLYKTTDGGNNWAAANTGIDVKNILCVAVHPTNPNIVLAGSSFIVTGSVGPSKIYRSTDGGSTWAVATGTPTDPAAINPNRFISFSTVNPSRVMVGQFMNTTDGGAYFSTDAGLTWTKKWTGAPSDVGTLLRSGIIRPGTTDEIYVGLDRSTFLNAGVWKSTDFGTTWATFNGSAMLESYGVRGLVFKDLPLNSTLYAGVATAVGQGIYEYTMPPVPVELLSFSASVNDNIVQLSWITATELNNSGFYIERKTENSSWQNIGYIEGNGTSSEKQYYNFSDEVTAAGNYFYRLKQTDYNGNFEYSFTVEVEVLQAGSYKLVQNYPNPFNPSTIISYTIPSGEQVTLIVYNVLGSEIATLVNEVQSQGSYSIRFEAGNLPSGIYFYTLTAGNYTETRKMILHK